MTLKLLNSVGWLYYYRGDYGPAREIYEETLSGQIDHLGIENLDSLKTLQDLGVLEGKSGNYQKAIEHFQICASAYEAQLGPEHPTTLRSLAFMVQQYKNHFEALDIQFRILPLSEKLFGEDRYTLEKIHDIGKV